MTPKVCVFLEVGDPLSEMVSKEAPWVLEKNISNLLASAFALTPYQALAPIQVDIWVKEEIKTLNARHRGRDQDTNVLAFPTLEKDERWAPAPLGALMVGDIVLSWATVKREAQMQDLSLEAHIAHLLVHGFLHLFHYDHYTEAEARVMEEIETKVLLQEGWPDPYKENPM